MSGAGGGGNGSIQVREFVTWASEWPLSKCHHESFLVNSDLSVSGGESCGSFPMFYTVLAFPNFSPGFNETHS